MTIVRFILNILDIESNGQPKSRLGMMQVNQNSATSKDLTESKGNLSYFIQ